MRPLRPSPLSRTLALVPPTIALVAQHASGAFNTFIKIGDIKGESVDEKHQSWIAATHFQFGVSNRVTLGPGGTEAGKASFSEITVSKQLDRSSPELFLNCAMGNHIDTVTLELTKSGYSSTVFYRITLNDVIVSSISTTGASGGDDKPAESISLNFTKIKIEYFVTDSYGKITEAIPAVGWDLATNTKL